MTFCAQFTLKLMNRTHTLDDLTTLYNMLFHSLSFYVLLSLT